MISKITDIFKEKKKTFSCEFFPPKTEKGVAQLFKSAEELMRYRPDFFSVTHGAGGSIRDDRTLEIVVKMQKEFAITVMHHLTCIGHSRRELANILAKIKDAGIHNILALRGDPPKDESVWRAHPEGFTYTYQLIRLIKGSGLDFSIGAAGFPEGHIDCPDREKDSDYLKIKVDSGAEFVITQLFFDNQYYADYMERAKRRDISVRIIPGVIPVTNYLGIKKFCVQCGASIPQAMARIFDECLDDEDLTYSRGIEYAVRQSRELLARGAPGLHFYTLNKSDTVGNILKEISLKD